MKLANRKRRFRGSFFGLLPPAAGPGWPGWHSTPTLLFRKKQQLVFISLGVVELCKYYRWYLYSG
jgi:hypothetical protein